MPSLSWQPATCQESSLRTSSLAGGASLSECQLLQGDKVLELPRLARLLAAGEEAARAAHALLRLRPRLHLPSHHRPTFSKHQHTHAVDKWFELVLDKHTTLFIVDKGRDLDVPAS